MFYIYVLQSKINSSLYTGFTIDLERRLQEHNQGKSYSTKRYKPWRIIYYEACLNDIDAKRRERYLKTTQGGRLLKRRLKEFFYEIKSNDFSN